MTPSTLSAQEYTITQTAFTYQIPVYVSNPTWCAIIYNYTIASATGDAALKFDPATRIFTFSQVNDLTLSGSTMIDYVVTVTGKAGITIPVQAQRSFTLTIRNPCINSAYVTINQSVLVDKTYTLYS